MSSLELVFIDNQSKAHVVQCKFSDNLIAHTECGEVKGDTLNLREKSIDIFFEIKVSLMDMDQSKIFGVKPFPENNLDGNPGRIKNGGLSPDQAEPD